MPRILTYQAGACDVGRLVRDVIRDEWKLVAHDLARAKYRTPGGITVDGDPVMVNRILKEGETLRVVLANEDPGKIVPSGGSLDILYEDDDVLVVNKPSGIVVHPSHGHFADTLSNFVARYYIDSGEPHEVRTAGRLDKDTSGLVAFGKSRTASAHLMGQTGDGPFEKTYLALAQGVFSCSYGTVEAPISREYEEKIRRVVRDDGDHAVTHYRVMKQFADYAVLMLNLDTGRTHQIRVHMAHIGHPLLGDPIYNPDDSSGMSRAALHAWKGRFRQPFTGELINVTAPVPDDMSAYTEI